MRINYLPAALLLGGCLAAAQEPAAPEATPATAPTAPAEPADAPPAAEEAPVLLDTIEVTALRRTERLQDVPVAVTALTRDQIESRRIQRLDDLNSIAPGLQISRSPANTTISQITIRGSSQINPAIYWDPAVGVYLDGVYIGKAQGSIFDVVDLAGVEVLRGPQGTLYGRNTIGGTINFLTREPSGVFSGTVGLEFGNYNARVARASLDLPRLGFADITLGVRSERRDGWVSTTPTSPVPELNNRHNDGIHIAANMPFSPALEALYRFDRGRVDQTNNYLQLTRSDIPGHNAYVDKERQEHADIDSESFEHSYVDGHSLTLTWNVGESDAIKTITGYRKVRWEDSLDLDGSPMMIAHTKRFTDYEQMSQDLQWIGSTERWNYTGGIYWFADDGYTDNPQTFFEGALNFDSRYGTETEAWAGYGQVDWQALDTVTLTGGLRYTREEKALDRVLGTSPVPGGPYYYQMPEGTVHPQATFTATTPMFSIAWEASERLNLYLRYAEGFKSGGFNGEYSNVATADMDEHRRETETPFRPEHQKSIELGAKMSFMGGRAVLNAAAFHNKLEDLQVSIFLGTGAAASVIRNAGKATVQGIELESALIPWEGTQLRLNYAFLDPQYDEFIDEGRDQADNRAFVHAPEHSYNAVLDSRLFEGGWGELRAVVDYVWTDEFYTYPYQLRPDPNPVPAQRKQEAENTKIEAHGLLNARLALAAIPLGQVSTAEIALWGRNILDEDTASNYIDFGAVFGNLTIANFVEPRTFGLAGILRW